MSKQLTAEFIEEYRKFPCLWKIKSEEYRDKKNKAYAKLLEKYKEIDPEATVKTLKNKIDSMRGSFRKELKKIKDSKRSGASEEDLYVPHLWYFNNLIFLMDQETPRESISSIDINSESQLNYSDLELLSPTASASIEEDMKALMEERTGSACSAHRSSGILTPRSATPTPSNNSVRRVYKRKASVNKADEILNTVIRQLETEKEDKFAVIGKNIANKLRDLPRDTAIVAEKIINDILFEADMGNLSGYSKAVIQDSKCLGGPEVSQCSNPTIPRFNNTPTESVAHYQELPTVHEYISKFNTAFATQLEQI